MRSTACNGNALFAENKLYELYDLYNENKELICGGLCVEKYDIFKNLVTEIFFSPFAKVYVRKTAIILRILEFTKVSHFID